MTHLLPVWRSTKLLGLLPRLTRVMRKPSLNDGLNGLAKPPKDCFDIQAACLNETLKVLGGEGIRLG